MAIVVTLDGTAQDNAASSTQVYTVVGTIPAGSLVSVMAAGVTNIQNVTGVTDSKGNSYVKQNANQNGTTESTNAITSILATGLSAGDTITVTWTASFTGHAVAVAWATNVLSATNDGTNKAVATSSSPSSGATATLAQSEEVAFGFVAANTSVVVTEDANFTNLANFTYGGGAHRFNAAYLLTASTAAVTYAPSLGSSQAWNCRVNTYKAVAATFVPYQPVYQSGPILAQ